jgi:hypothetical protein
MAKPVSMTGDDHSTGMGNMNRRFFEDFGDLIDDLS